MTVSEVLPELPEDEIIEWLMLNGYRIERILSKEPIYLGTWRSTT